MQYTAQYPAAAAQGSANDYYQQPMSQSTGPAQAPYGGVPGDQGGTTYQQSGQMPPAQQMGAAPGQDASAASEHQRPGPGEKQQDGLHRMLDKVEKKFGGERFNDPANYEKNQKLNDNIIRKLKRVGKMALRKAPGMVMKAMQ